ncbi:Trigger factor, partial [Ananas comosus]
MKIRVTVSSSKTQFIFDDVFSKLVAAAQPIPGFRRIPKDILLHIIGPSKVNRQTIEKIVNCTVAEFVEKEGIKVSKDLKVEQNLEDLEAAFQPGKDFLASGLHL